MKTRLYISAFLVALLLASGCKSRAYLFTSFQEPATDGLRLLYSRDALHWQDLDTVFLKPTIGQQRVMRDPSMVKGPDGTFHLVWTSSWKGDKGFGYASSKDLLNWSEQRFIPVMAHEPATVNVWAPELFYDDESQRFLIIWASTIPGRFPRGVEAEDNNHRMYMTSTADFKTFSATRLFYDPGFSVIDAVILKRAPGSYVLVLKDNTRPNRNMKIAFGRSASGPWSKASESFTPKLTEGPTAVRRAKDWLIYFDAYGDKMYPARKTSDFKTFKDISAEVSLPEGHKHGTIVPVLKSQLKKLLRAVNKVP
ncbi:glycoside hydrolase family 43 protein [Pedobacter sp. SYP-B3415]|uniref:glycoside hydrolase family 43 protein n=1 Tax=Pedobacter sp. SYP-B3415 TaxID=2496641 RepID=UPI001F0F2A31|nr:glycoside hydrolase family 43 protein [Pedobacter sp. SYP-B3415]